MGPPVTMSSPNALAVILLYSFFLVSASVTNFQHEVLKYKHAYNTHADAQRIGNSLLAPVASNVLASTSGFQIYTTDTIPANAVASSACSQALTANIACNATIQLMSYPFDVDSLTAMCTSGCSSSLLSYRSSVAKSCAGLTFTNSANATYAPTLAVDLISEPYFSQCRTDLTTGKFCSVVLQTFTNPNPSQGILGYSQANLCSSCMLGVLNTTLSNPVTFSNALYGTFQSALQTCGSSFSSYNVSTSVSTSIFTPAPGSPALGSNVTIDATCALRGRNVTLTSTSTCASLSAQFSVTQHDILSSNPNIIPANCASGLAAQTQICVPQSCTLYSVQANQTCDDIVSDVNTRTLAGQQNITVAQLQSFNPSITQCSNVSSGNNTSVCITPHGGFPSLGNGGGSAVPNPTPTAVVPPPGQTAPGTTSACGSWYLVQPNNFCQQVALNNSITLDDFIALNPEIDANCTNLWANYYYCVAPFPPFNQVTATPTLTANSSSATIGILPLTTAPTTSTPLVPLPSASGITAPTNVADGTILNGCGYYYVVNSGDNCTAVEQFFNMTDADFQNFNDNPAAPCPSLVVGSAVCVQVLNATDTIPPTPTNAAAGSAPSGCARWYTIVSGDLCPSVEQKFGLSSAQFFALNPEVKSDCTNLALGEAYCVKAIGQPSAGNGAVPPPANVVLGTDTQNCTKYDTVISGDSCPVIETRNNVTDAIFRALNPEINTACTNIQLGGAYCVKPVAGFTVAPGPPANVVTGTDTKDCAKYDTIISGDSCPVVEARNNITDSLFRALNPEINAACTNIQLGGAYCVKAVPGFTITPTSTTTTSTPVTSPTGAPTNIAAGSWTNCTTYYTVVSGDSCQAIDTKFQIALSDFLLWNPEITPTCSNLQLSAYCVIGSKKCAKIYTVVSGDFCSKIETANGLTDAKFRTLNPWLDTNCDLQIGQNLCVG